jgi:uncharacterized membrane protein
LIVDEYPLFGQRFPHNPSQYAPAGFCRQPLLSSGAGGHLLGKAGVALLAGLFGSVIGALLSPREF